MGQVFRFCCRCVRMMLIQDGKCLCCKKDFLVKGEKDNNYKTTKI